MLRLVPFALAAFVLTLSACDTAPVAHASAGPTELQPYELRDDMIVHANSEKVALEVQGSVIELTPVEMYALSEVAMRAAYDNLSDEQRAIFYEAETVSRKVGRGRGPRCDGKPDVNDKGQAGFMLGLGGGCPPPPPPFLTPDLAYALYGDYFDIGELPQDRGEPIVAGWSFNP